MTEANKEAFYEDNIFLSSMQENGSAVGSAASVPSLIIDDLKHDFFSYLIDLCRERADRQFQRLVKQIQEEIQFNWNPGRWVVRKSNSQYDVYDYQVYDINFSITSLHALKQTNGHSH